MVRRHPRHILTLVLAGVVALGATSATADDDADRDDHGLRAVETAFAATMADRDLQAFASFLDDETIFYAGPTTELRGKAAVVEAWARFFEGEQAPFSWGPEVVSVLDSGDLGLSSGPVLDPAGERIGTFNSIWRRNADGEWKIIFDRGCH